jgi:hypothetical protein
VSSTKSTLSPVKKISSKEQNSDLKKSGSTYLSSSKEFQTSILEKDKSRRKRSERVKQKTKATPTNKESKEFKSGALKLQSQSSQQKSET